MKIIKKKYLVTIEKEIEVSFDKELMEDKDFCEAHIDCFYGFDTIEEHMEHIAQFYARFYSLSGMDGYCGLHELGKPFQIDADELSEEIEIEEQAKAEGDNDG